MPHDIIMPSLGMSQDSGTIVKWKKSVGDFVNAGEEIMEVETDKAIQAIESPVSGYLKQILFDEDVPVPVGEVVAQLDNDLENTPKPSSEFSISKTMESQPQIQSPTVDSRWPVNEEDRDGKLSEKPNPNQPLPFKLLASPKAKQYSRQFGFSLEGIAESLGKTIIHYRDLETYQKNLTSEDQKKVPSENVGQYTTLEIATEGTALKRLQKEKPKDSSSSPSLGVKHVVAVLILKAWREIFAESSKSLSILIQSYANDFKDEKLIDADLLPFKEVISSGLSDKEDAVDMRLIDLLDTSISSLHFNFNEVITPTVTVYYDHDRLMINLQNILQQDWKKNLLFLTSLANYLQEPILYLH